MTSKTVDCRRCGKTGDALGWPPYAGDAGGTIVESICAACWPEWLELQTKLINEHRLNVLDPAHQEMMARQCLIFLGLAEGEAMEVPGVPPGTETKE